MSAPSLVQLGRTSDAAAPAAGVFDPAAPRGSPCRPTSRARVRALWAEHVPNAAADAALADFLAVPTGTPTSSFAGAVS